MLRGNTITLRLARGHVSQTGNLYQYDYGQRLILIGVDLPNAYEVHFSNQEHGQSKTMIGDATGVDIPDEYLLSGDNIHVWIYLHDGSSDGETEYHGIIGVTKRAKPTDQQPTPAQQSVIDQAIAALNAGVTEVEGIAEGIPQTIDTALQEAKDSGEFDGFSPVIETTEITGGHQVSITDATHTETIDVMDGEKGDPGRDGVDGFSPSASVSKSGKVATISITDKDGTTTAEISDGEDGQDGATGATPVISIGTVSKLSPGSDPTASMDVTDPEHPVLSLGLVTGDPGEVTEDELSEAVNKKAGVITKTVVDTPVATVTDGADGIALAALKVAVNPIQTGSGDPYPGGGGKNKFDPTNTLICRISDAGNIVDQGNNAYRTFYCPTLKAGTWTISVTGLTSNRWVRSMWSVNGEKTIIGYSTTTNYLTFTLENDVTDFYMSFRKSNSEEITETIYVQIESGSTATAFAPYSNIRPISGWSAVTIEHSGVNLFEDSLTGKGINASGKITNSASNNLYLGQVKAGVTYTFSTGGGNFAYAFYTAKPQDEDVSYNGTRTTTNTTFTAPIDGWIAVRLASDYASPMLVVGSTVPTEYTAHTGASHIATLGQTVFGGYVDWVGGQLVITHWCVEMSSKYWTYNSQYTRFTTTTTGEYKQKAMDTRTMRILCSMYKAVTDGRAVADVDDCSIYNQTSSTTSYIYVKDTSFNGDVDAFKTAVTGQYMVYPLDTPITVPLSDLDTISTVKGINNLWADSGDILLMEYPVDTKTYIGEVADGKADKVASAIANNFAGLDSNGNLIDSGHKHSDYLTAHQDISGKADKVSGGTADNLAALDGNGNLKDAGTSASALVESISQKADIIHDTVVNAPVASIPDGASNRLLTALLLAIDPIQTGSGDPYPAGGGRNKFNAQYTSEKAQQYCNFSNGIFTVKSVPSANDSFLIGTVDLKAGQSYILNGGYSNSFRCYVRVDNTNYASAGSDSNVFTPESDQTVNITVVLNSDASVGWQLKPMIRLSSVSDSSFTPYENIRPISGRTSAVVSQSGKNLLDYDSIGTVVVDANANERKGIIFETPGTYIIKATKTGSTAYIMAKVKYENGSYGSGKSVVGSNGTTEQTIVIGTGDKLIVYDYTSTDDLATAKAKFSAWGIYTAPITQHTAQLGQTVYGGYVDWVNGQLVIDHALDTMTGNNVVSVGTASSGINYARMSELSSRGVTTTAANKDQLKSNLYVASKDATVNNSIRINANTTPYAYNNDLDTLEKAQTFYNANPLQIWYPLYTPIEIPLSDLDIIRTAQTAGENNFWSDAGNIVKIEYPADTKLYIDKKLAEIQALILENN